MQNPAYRGGVRIFVCLLCVTGLSLNCASKMRAQDTGNGVFRNTDPRVAYVGSQTCVTSGCHEEIGRSYPMTPMGHSMAPANSASQLALAAKPFTYSNQRNGRYYDVYQDGKNLYQSVYELDKRGKKVNEAVHKMDYVVGAELTGYSYLFRVGPWFFQAPLSYYSNSRTWELSPGYVDDDLGFTRHITTQCMACHNGQPNPRDTRNGVFGEPAFRFGELAIGCETCHGPGALHVEEMGALPGRALGANEVDTSIVNPAKLSPRLADDVCRACHQAGDAAVVAPGKSILDYRPGLSYGDFVAFLRRPIRPEQREEVNRLEKEPPVRGSMEQPLWWKNSSLELSKCYEASHGKLTCITCHSIHHTYKREDKVAFYRARCLRCHSEASCKLKPDDVARSQAGDNCIGCHMEKRAVAGIAHSSDTKHRIVRYPGQPLPEAAFVQPDLAGLLWLNRPSKTTAISDRALLEGYWTIARKDPTLWQLWYRKLETMRAEGANDPLVMNYLGAIALEQKKDSSAAADYFSRALKLGSDEPMTYLNLGVALQNCGRSQDAEAVLQKGTAEFPWNGPLIARMAVQYAMDGQSWRAYSVIKKYRQVFPEDPVVRQALEQVNNPRIPVPETYNQAGSTTVTH
jgi:hypothetical protein